MRRAATSDALPRTTFQGLPPLTGSLIDKPGGGELFPQPLVGTSSGQTQLLDEVIGADIAVVALARAGLQSGDLVAGAPVSVVSVGDDIDAPLVAGSGRLEDWFRDRDACVAVLRPDRYVYALLSDAGATNAAVTELSRAIGRI
jgi:3-(3-hydroxy-phenyl)propionate hydroxylase